MRNAFKLFAAVAAFVAVTVLLYATPANAEVRIYNHTVKFTPSTPASIVAKAYEPIEFSIVGQRQELNALVLPPPLDPSIVYIQQPTQLITAEYLNQGMISTAAVAPPATVSSLRVPGLTAGKYKIRLMYPKGEIFDEREIVVNDAGTRAIVESRGWDGPNAFSLAAFAASALTPYPGVPGGPSFGAWLANENAPAESTPLFHLTYSMQGLVMNFYTISVNDRNLLRTIGWQYQGELVNVLPATGGTCPAGGQAVYRAFRPMKAGMWLPTHRYTTDVTAYREWARSGNWAAEGIAFCARVLTEQLAETF
jgi:Repeat of unknown function (DUF5648)